MSTTFNKFYKVKEKNLKKKYIKDINALNNPIPKPIPIEPLQ